MRVVVVGGGAAGVFAALAAKEHHPGAEVVVLEKSDKLLAKVRISGGGRCNVTHACADIRKLAAGYPRGGRFLRRAFRSFAVPDTIAWFLARGVVLKTEDDGRMFPVTDDSATIADCLLGEAERAGVRIRTRSGVAACAVDATGGDRAFELSLTDGGTLLADRLIVAAGGHPKPEAYAWLAAMGHRIVPPVPSLFTFNMPDEPVRALMGTVADPVRVRIAGGSDEATGPLLVTHWGMSGPAVLRLSAWSARRVHAMGYRFTAQLNWLGGVNEEEVRGRIAEMVRTTPRRTLANADRFGLPKRLWAFLLDKAGIPVDRTLDALPRKERDRLADILTNDRYAVRGKTTFKEEFVTAGGVSLDEVDPATMRSLRVPGLSFAGEVLDIDGITGGYNFQAAWTTGHIAGRSAG